MSDTPKTPMVCDAGCGRYALIGLCDTCTALVPRGLMDQVNAAADAYVASDFAETEAALFEEEWEQVLRFLGKKATHDLAA